jgi:hypothetical protein
MGTSLRIFLVNDDDSVQSLPFACYERLMRHDPKESLPQYAGKRVRYAMVVVDLINRIPTEILRTEHSFLSFDSEGRLDPGDKEKQLILGLDTVPPLLASEDEPEIIDARHRFAKKRYDNEYSWTPTQEIVKAIVSAIFGRS